MFFHIFDEIGSHFSWNSLCRHWRAVWAWWKLCLFLQCLCCCWTVTAALQAGWAAARTSSPSCVVHLKLDLPTMHNKPTIRYHQLEGSSKAQTGLARLLTYVRKSCITCGPAPPLGRNRVRNVIMWLETNRLMRGLVCWLLKTSNTKWSLAHLLSYLS